MAEKRQAALAVTAEGTIRSIHIVAYQTSTVRFIDRRRFASASSVWRTCSVPALGWPVATQNVGYATVRLDTGGQLTNAVATSAADDGAIQALSFSKPSARGISGTKRAVVQKTLKTGYKKRRAH